ncbi:MAG: tetratricopeptide repeat protein [Planctomycetes bacterium]|nr:tetratricopeptide repeat protein [Planctomycetota bacterium]
MPNRYLKERIAMDITQDNIVEQENATQHYEVLMELGDCHTSVGNHDEAKKCYEKAASLSPDAPEPYVGLGVIAYQEDCLEDSEIAFRVACRLDGKCSKGYGGLAMIAQQRQDYDQAFDMYLKCLELDTDNLIALLGLFQVSCQTGSFSKVIHYLEVYLDMHPGDSSVQFSLAALYLRDGRFIESKKVLMDILALEPLNKEASDLLEEVEHNLAQKRQEVVL